MLSLQVDGDRSHVSVVKSLLILLWSLFGPVDNDVTDCSGNENDVGDDGRFLYCIFYCSLTRKYFLRKIILTYFCKEQEFHT